MVSTHFVRCGGVTSSNPSSRGSTWLSSTHDRASGRDTWYLLYNSSTSQSARGNCFNAHEERLNTTGIGWVTSLSAASSRSRANSNTSVVLPEPSSPSINNSPPALL